MTKRRRVSDFGEKALVKKRHRGSQSDEEEDEEDHTQNDFLQGTQMGIGDVGFLMEEDLYDGWYREAGMIEYIKMRNFMCHAELDYRPSCRLNFLSGVNGSGKSAIMSALTFGLGGSARQSNRGTSNKNFIRTNQSQATVEISLLNRGENAWKPETYGKSLIIQRTVNANGSGSYKLKNEKGKVVLEKRVKEELDRILSCFNIQVDNPIAILNQDTAKTFLFKCQPTKLYEFFMSATQLDDCLKDYLDAGENFRKAHTTLGIKEKHLVDKAKEVEHWKKKYDYHQTLVAKRAKLDDMRKELAYAMCKRASQEYEDAKERATKINTEIYRCKESIEKEVDYKNALKHERSSYEAEIESLASVAQDHEKELSETRENVKSIKNEQKNVSRKKEELLLSKDRKVGQLNAVKRAIASIHQDDTSTNAANAALDREKQITALETKREALEAKFSSTSNHASNLSHSIDVCTNAEKDINVRIRQAKHSLDQVASELNSVQGHKDPLVLFGEKMPKFVKAIREKSTAFVKMPIGPLGAEIKLKPDTGKLEAKLIENELGNMLQAFIVDNFNDRRTLSNLAQNNGLYNLTIFTTKFASKVHNVAHGRCNSPDYPTILDLLDIENPNVTNCLIDQKKIEKILLMRRDIEAQELLMAQHTVPQNCLFALTGDFNQFYPAPSYRSYAINLGRRQNSVLQTSMSEHLARLQNDIEDSRSKLSQLNGDLAEIKDKRKEHEQEHRKAVATCKQLMDSISALKNEMDRLKQASETEKPPDLSALEEDMERFQEEIQNIDNEMRKLGALMAEKEANLKEAVRKCRAKEEEMEGTSKVDELHEKLAKIDKQLQTHELDRIRAEKEVQRLEARKMEEIKKAKIAEKKLEGSRKICVDNGGNPVETDRAPEEIDREIRIIEEGLNRQARDHEPKEYVDKMYLESSKFLIKVTEDYEILKQTVEYLNEMVRTRRIGYLQIRGSMCRRVKLKFRERLSTRKFYGNLEFSHQGDKTLNLTVCPEGLMSKKRDMKTLSGGEKSFSTVSLVLALWECIEPPFRILDEFDVFMDMVNRRTALEMMINYATEKRRFQYIFLTPLTMKSVETSDDVRIVYLKKTDGS